ncbi:MAG: sigma-70 family RNA polymerase sigma factor [Cyclobacteriaceae bacterium]
MSVNLWSNDKMVWDQFRNGCDYSFKVIYENHVQNLLLYGRRLNNDRDLVANCVQQLFANLLDRRKHLGPTDNINYYLLKAFRSILIKELKKSQRLTADELKIEQNTSVNSVEDEIIYEESLRQQKKKLQSAMSNLSPREKEILYLKYFANIANKEIAELLSISYQSVKNTATRAIQKLKDEIMKVA